MPVTCYHDQALRSEVEVDAVHYRAQLVLSCSEETAIDVLGQHGVGNDNLGGRVADGLGSGKRVGTLNGEGKKTVLVGHFGTVGLKVYLEGDRLFRETLYSLKQVVVANSKTAVHVTLYQLELGVHHIFAV